MRSRHGRKKFELRKVIIEGDVRMAVPQIEARSCSVSYYIQIDRVVLRLYVGGLAYSPSLVNCSCITIMLAPFHPNQSNDHAFVDMYHYAVLFIESSCSLFVFRYPCLQSSASFTHVACYNPFPSGNMCRFMSWILLYMGEWIPLKAPCTHKVLQRLNMHKGKPHNMPAGINLCTVHPMRLCTLPVGRTHHL